jgi:hypothetical protein
MFRCWLLLGIGLVVVICHRRIGRWHHDEYLRRRNRNAAYRQAYLRRWDFRRSGS